MDRRSEGARAPGGCGGRLRRRGEGTCGGVVDAQRAGPARQPGGVGPGPAGNRQAAGAGDHERPSAGARRSEEHTSELQSLMRISYAVFCLKKINITTYATYVSNLHIHNIT